jgi:hypothetical protein
MPINENEIRIVPETEVEAFYINKFLLSWSTGCGKILLSSGIQGNDPANKLELLASMPKLISQTNPFH